MAKDEISENVENDDDFISLEEDDIEEEKSSEESQEPLESSSGEPNHKLLYILIAVFTVLAFALLGLLLYLYFDKQEAKEEAAQTTSIIENIQNKETTPVKTESYEALVAEAKRLYEQGKKEEALAIYNDISEYNRALSFYNIGVTKLKKQQYKSAIDAFMESIKVDKLKFESALNIAVASYGMGDEALFGKYLNLATKELSTKIDSPLYSYYRSLIDYYRGFYAEAIVPLRHQSSSAYQKKQNHLLAKLYTAFDIHKEAAKILEQNDRPEDAFTLGLLYANQEEYTLADKYLLKATEGNPDGLQENMALALVYMKMGLFKKAADLINKVYSKHKADAAEMYPIKVSLKPSLFDPIAAQKAFQKHIFFNDRNKFSLIFYYAPYRLMSPKQSIDTIHQGAKNIYIDAFDPALDKLGLSGKIADANIEITKGVKAALSHKLHAANDIFQEGIKKYPSSAELHYNLALTYAKMYDFQKAYKHFKRSSVLDTTYHFAPLFADLCGQLLFIEREKKMLINIENSVTTATDSTMNETVLALISIIRKDIVTVNIDNTNIFDNVLLLILAQIRQDSALYQKSTSALLKKTPDDLISNILAIDAYHDKQDIQAYSREIQAKLAKPSLNFEPLFSGHAFVKELYIEILNIAGIVPQAKRMMEQKVREKGINDIASLQALAYADIYVGEFDQAYAIYNNLIDEHKQQDSNTLFLASIASIGANHHENAIALLELAKLTNESNFESRFALGILYHEAKNLEGAAIQYNKIGNGGFQSRYFTFSLDKTVLKQP